MQENVETQKQENKQTKTNSWTKNIVTDLDAPQFYSPRAIWGFSVFFTVIFGAVLLSSNLTDKKAKWIVIGFGILYTTVVIVIMNLLPQPNTGLTIGLNGGGALILTSIFWGKYVGKETKFRTKQIWKPLIISILITIPFLLAIIYG
jgi:drug/metabolite transporter superfamily protein YnfA